MSKMFKSFKIYFVCFTVAFLQNNMIKFKALTKTTPQGKTALFVVPFKCPY